MSLRIPITCSSSLIWASGDTNCVLSVGFSGSWFLSCATRRFRNISSVDDVEPLVVDDDDDELLEADDPVTALTADAIRCSLGLFAGGDTAVQLLDPTGPRRSVLPPVAFLLARTAGLPLRIPVLRAGRAGAGLVN